MNPFVIGRRQLLPRESAVRSQDPLYWHIQEFDV